MRTIKNVTFDKLKIGQSVTVKKKLMEKDIHTFALMSGDINPIHTNTEYAKHSEFGKRIAHGMWSGSIIAMVMGTKLPGPGSMYVSQNLNFKKPVFIGDTIHTTITVVKKNSKNKHVIFDCKCTNQKKEVVTQGKAELIAPVEEISIPAMHLPKIFSYDRGKKLLPLLHKALKQKKPLAMGIVYPISESSLQGAILAAEKGLIKPVIIGPMDQIKKTAKKIGYDICQYECIDKATSKLSAKYAVELAKEGTVNALMKGDLHTDELMQFVIAHESGLRTDRRMTHCFVIDVPTYHKLLVATDVAINIAPTVHEKIDIVQNSIDFSIALGVEKPKVAILSAVETVLENMPATLDAAILCKMADRNEITGGILDGPLSFDTAISKEVALGKNLKSPVSGDPDILVMPNIDTGNILMKALEFLAFGQSAGMVLGAKVPIVLTSRAASSDERLISCALAKLYADRNTNDGK